METLQLTWNTYSPPTIQKRKLVYNYKRPNSYVNAVSNNSPVLLSTTSSTSPMANSPPCLKLPREIWLMILVNYGITAKDLAQLEMSCKWFSTCWEGYSLIEEAARLIIKRFKRLRYKTYINKLSGLTWKERLHTLNIMDSNSCTLASGSYQNITLTNEGCVLTWGAGMFGQLGNGLHGDQASPQNITPNLPLDAKVTQVSAGCGHTGILTNQGEVYVCGDNRYGQLGLQTNQGQHVLTPMRITNVLDKMHVIQIACGSSHTMFLCDTGKVYTVGQGDSGQLGLGSSIKATSAPVCLPLQYDEFNFIFIAVGIAHNVLLTECGKAFTCGLGSVGQLGHGGTKNLSTLAQVTAKVRDHKIIHAAASVCHTVLISSTGEVFTCGKGEGTLGHGDTKIKTIPARVEALVGIPIVNAAAGVGRTVFIARDGRGFWCGEGMGNHRNIVTSIPTEMVQLREPLVAAAIGNSHIVLKMKSGHYMSMGNNGRYQTGVITNEQSPVLDYMYITNI